MSTQPEAVSGPVYRGRLLSGEGLAGELGRTYGSTRQWVKYYNDGGMEMRRD